MMKTVKHFLQACGNQEESVITEYLADAEFKLTDGDIKEILQASKSSPIIQTKILNHINEHLEQFPVMRTQRLIFACLYGLKEMVESYFPDVPEELLFSNFNHRIYFLFAALNHPEILAFLLSQDKINPNALSIINGHERSVLEIACDPRQNAPIKSIELLLNHPKIIIRKSDIQALLQTDELLECFLKNYTITG